MATATHFAPGEIVPKEGPASDAQPVRKQAAAAAARRPVAELTAEELGPNNEHLEELRPDLASCLRELILGYRQEGIVARRHEIRRIRQARLFWQGIQYAWWNPQDAQWHLPFESKIFDDQAMEDGPRFQFVTNLFQAFGLTFIAVMSQDVPTTEFYPQSAQNPGDIATAKAASDIAELAMQNNKATDLLTWIGFYLWTDGKLGGYVRYVADGQKFGFDEQPQYASNTLVLEGTEIPQLQVTSVRRVPRGQEVISIVDGLQLNTPVWAREQGEFPYLQWQQEVHIAKLKAAYPVARDKIQMGGPIQADDIYARASRVALSQGMPATEPGDALYNLVTYSRTWIRPWGFYQLEDAAKRDELLQLFPDGCYVAFAGETYCESRNEGMDDHWRVMHALPGDGQNRPAVGSSLIDVQERYNTLSNIQAETYEYGIPPIYADPQVLDFEALANQTAEPAAHYPARARPGMALADGFFQPAPATMSADAMQHLADLFGPIAQFLTGLFPSIFGGEVGKTAAEYSMARDQALGRIGLVWRTVKEFWSDIMLLAVECFRQNRADDVEIPQLGAGGDYESKWIRQADLKGNIQAHPESDESYPRLKSQQRAALQQLLGLAGGDPQVQQMLSEPENVRWIKNLSGLNELVSPDEDAANKQRQEITQLLASAPTPVPSAQPGQPVQWRSTVPVDEELDDHQAEARTGRRWANSPEGRRAKTENPAGFANVRAHIAEHDAVIAKRAAAAAAAPNKPPSVSIPFHELPPEGQAQAAAKAGIRLNPLQLAFEKAAEQQTKRVEAIGRLNHLKTL